MKKTIALLISLVFVVFCFASCSKDDAYALYQKSLSNIEETGGFDVNMVISATTADDSQISINGIFKSNGDNSYVKLVIPMLGTTEVYIVDDYVYTSAFGYKVKQTVSDYELENDTDSNDIKDMLPELTEKDIKDVKVSKKDGIRTFEVTIDKETIKELSDFVNEITASSDTTVEYSDILFTASFDKNDNITFASVKIECTASNEGNSKSTEIEVKLTFNNPGEVPQISAPADADKYE